METAEGFGDIRRKVNKMLSEFSTIDSSSPFSIDDVMWGDFYSSNTSLSEHYTYLNKSSFILDLQI